MISFNNTPKKKANISNNRFPFLQNNNKKYPIFKFEETLDKKLFNAKLYKIFNNYKKIIDIKIKNNCSLQEYIKCTNNLKNKIANDEINLIETLCNNANSITELSLYNITMENYKDFSLKSKEFNKYMHKNAQKFLINKPIQRITEANSYNKTYQPNYSHNFKKIFTIHYSYLRSNFRNFSNFVHKKNLHAKSIKNMN